MDRRLASFALVMCLVSSMSLHAQEAVDPRVRAELVEAREAVWRAYYQGDSAALVRTLPAHMTAMGQDRAEIIKGSQGYASSGRKYVGMEFTHDQFFVNGNVAIVWSHFVAKLLDERGKPDSSAGRAIELFVKENGRWLNPHWHLDSDKGKD